MSKGLLNKQINESPEPLRSYIHDFHKSHGEVAHLIQDNFALSQKSDRLESFIAKPKSGMYGERDVIRVGKFTVALFDWKEHNGLWIEDTETGEGGQFNGANLENAIHNLWNEHF